MSVNGHILKLAVLGGVVAAFGACAPRPQTTAIQGSAPQQGRSTSGIGTAPGVGAGAGTPSVNVTGGGLGGAEFTHPGITGTGHAH